jgi:hypothetical protein
MTDGDSSAGAEADPAAAVASFLDAVDRTLGEYDQGYMDADAALALVRAHVDDLRRSVEDGAADGGD